MSRLRFGSSVTLPLVVALSLLALPSIAAAAEPAPAWTIATPAPDNPWQVADTKATVNDVHRSETLRDSLITIDANLSDQFPLGSDQKIRPGGVTNQLVIGGTARLRIAPGLAVFFRRVNHDNIAGATNGSGFGSWSYDIEGDYGVEYAINRDLRIESFWKYRYRTYSPNAGDATAFSATSKTPAGPRVERGIMTGVTYRFGPKTKIGRSFLISEEAQLYAHHLDYTIQTNPAFIKANNTLNGQMNGSDSTLLFETHVYYYASIWGQDKFVPYVGYENKPTYFDNNPQPGFQNRVRYGVVSHLSPTIAIDTYVKNDHSYPAGAGQAHNTTLFTDLLVHLKS